MHMKVLEYSACTSGSSWRLKFLWRVTEIKTIEILDSSTARKMSGQPVAVLVAVTLAFKMQTVKSELSRGDVWVCQN